MATYSHFASQGHFRSHGLEHHIFVTSGGADLPSSNWGRRYPSFVRSAWSRTLYYVWFRDNPDLFLTLSRSWHFGYVGNCVESFERPKFVNIFRKQLGRSIILMLMKLQTGCKHKRVHARSWYELADVNQGGRQSSTDPLITMRSTINSSLTL